MRLANVQWRGLGPDKSAFARSPLIVNVQVYSRVSEKLAHEDQLGLERRTGKKKIKVTKKSDSKREREGILFYNRKACEQSNGIGSQCITFNGRYFPHLLRRSLALGCVRIRHFSTITLNAEGPAALRHYISDKFQ